MDENAMEFVAIGGSFLDKVDVVDFAPCLTFSETRLAEDSANAAILDIDEYPGDAEGRFMGLEMDGCRCHIRMLFVRVLSAGVVWQIGDDGFNGFVIGGDWQ